MQLNILKIFELKYVFNYESHKTIKQMRRYLGGIQTLTRGFVRALYTWDHSQCAKPLSMLLSNL